MNEEYFPIEDHDEIRSDHVFTSHLARRDKYISELESLSESARDDHIQTIKEEDGYLLKYRRTRNLFGIPLNDEMKQFEPFHYVKIVETNNSLWAIADDMRDEKEHGYFETYREAYKWAEENMYKKGVTITAKKLEKAYHKAKSEGIVE